MRPIVAKSQHSAERQVVCEGLPSRVLAKPRRGHTGEDQLGEPFRSWPTKTDALWPPNPKLLLIATQIER